jgi:UDP-N-acetylmuramoylalanine--D-glutamate ligase
VRRVSVLRSIDDGISAHDGVLRDKQKNKVVVKMDLSGFAALRGRHNWQNACMAYGAATALGIKADVIAQAMASFPGLAHRMQQVGKLGSTIFVNDSKATNADAAEKALTSFDNIYWIAGGLAKDGGVEALFPHLGAVKKAYLIGVAAPVLAQQLNGKIPFVVADTMARAVMLAAEDAAASKAKQPVVLLSPACASFDQYKNFEVRGDAFVSAVAAVPNIQMNGETT